MDDIDTLLNYTAQKEKFRNRTLRWASAGIVGLAVAGIEHISASAIFGVASLAVSGAYLISWDEAVTKTDKLEHKVFYDFSEALDTWQTE